MNEKMNGYYRRTIKIDTTKWCYTIGEGMGLNATFYVTGYIDVSERVGGGWNARVSARALASNMTQGEIYFAANATMYGDGQKIRTSDLSKNGTKVTSTTSYCYLGEYTFSLPDKGKVEIEMDVSYVLVLPGSVVGVNNFLGNIGYKINETLGKWLGKIRERIN